MKPRHAEVDLRYNGAAVKTVMDEYITSITYTDPASGAMTTGYIYPRPRPAVDHCMDAYKR